MSKLTKQNLIVRKPLDKITLFDGVAAYTRFTDFNYFMYFIIFYPCYTITEPRQL